MAHLQKQNIQNECIYIQNCILGAVSRKFLEGGGWILSSKINANRPFMLKMRVLWSNCLKLKTFYFCFSNSSYMRIIISITR